MRKIALGKRARKHKGLETVIDAEDFEELSQYNWYASYSPKIDRFYVQRQIPLGGRDQSSVRMHRHLMGAGAGDRVVHLNGDTLDNRRNNLKVVRKGHKEVRDDKVKDRDDLGV